MLGTKGEDKVTMRHSKKTDIQQLRETVTEHKACKHHALTQTMDMPAYMPTHLMLPRVVIQDIFENSHDLSSSPASVRLPVKAKIPVKVFNGHALPVCAAHFVVVATICTHMVN